MAANTVLVTADLRLPERDCHMGLESLLDDPDYEIRFRSEDSPGTLQPSEIRNVDVVLAIGCEITESSLEGSSLRGIGKFGSGMDAVDIPACTAAGIPVFNSPQGIRDSVAQATLGYLITSAHRFKEYDTRIRTVGFPDRHVGMGRELFGATLGIVGFGLIGRRVAELVEPFDMEVQAYDPYVAGAEIPDRVSRVDLDTLLETSDFLSLHCPLTDETEGLLDEAAFRRMKDSAALVNTARGGIYSDATLARAIREDWIAGAAIDVFEGEPAVADNPLLDLDDCLLTPHVAGVTRDSMRQVGAILSRSVRTLVAGGVPDNVFNPSTLPMDVPDEKRSPSYVHGWPR